MSRWLLVSILTVAACSGTVDEPLDLTELEDFGPHAIGFRLYESQYLAPGTSESRTSNTFVWYAAEAAEGERPIYTLRTSEIAVTDAPPLDLGELPVVVFSHGSQAYAAAMSHWMEHLASHGFLVIAPMHTGNTFIDGDNRTTDIYYLRPHDVSSSLDLLSNIQGDPLSGKVGDRVAVAGHSFGAYTAFLVAGGRHAVDELDAECVAGTASTGYCSALDDDSRALFRAGFDDSRFDAVISIDPGDFNLLKRSGVERIDLPVLHMVAEKSGHDRTDISTDDYWNALDGPEDTRMLLVGGDHNDFVDACDLDFDLGCSELRPASVWRVTRALALAFLRKQLLGDLRYDAVLDGTVSLSDLAQVRGR